MRAERSSLGVYDVPGSGLSTAPALTHLILTATGDVGTAATQLLECGNRGTEQLGDVGPSGWAGVDLARI